MRKITITISALAFAALLLTSPAEAVFFHIGSGSIDGSLCVGNDCVSSEAFGFDTIRIKENNLRFHFDDTSTAASFPPNDWRLYANDSANGGSSYFGVEDATAGRFVFRVFAGARSNALTVDSQGDVGLGTTTPATDIDIKIGDTPTLRLQQDGTSGFTPQTWDVAGNETSFFIRDSTSGSTLPFRIMTGGAPSSSLVIDGDGDVGLGTTSPDRELEIVTDGPGVLLTNNGTAGGGWEIFMNGNTGRFNWRDKSTNNIPVKVDPGAVTNLLQIGVAAAGQVDINGDLNITGQCTETDGACAPDYVFEPDYELLSLDDLESFILANKHLPKVPSASEFDAKGINLRDMSYILLEKVEELTLYTLEQQDRLADLHSENDALRADLEALKAALEAR